MRMTDKIASQKNALRKTAVKLRHQFSHMYDGTIAEKAALHGMLALKDLAPGSHIAAYLPIGDELDPRPLMRDLTRRGHTCLLPVVIEKDAPLIFRPWESGDPLEDGPLRTQHPISAAPTMVPDIIIMPLLAFDQAGGRLGWGGGYYDRTLALYSSAQTFGFAFAGQMVDHVPMGDHDKAMDAIITETGTHWCQQTGA